MKAKPGLRFDPIEFLAKTGEGRAVVSYAPDEVIFAQGDPADAVFYLQTGRVKLTIISGQGKEAVVGIYSATDFFGEASLAGQLLRIDYDPNPIAVAQLPNRSAGQRFGPDAPQNASALYMLGRAAVARLAEYAAALSRPFEGPPPAEPPDPNAPAPVKTAPKRDSYLAGFRRGKGWVQGWKR